MTTKNVHQRIAEVMKQVTYIRKERKQGMKYTIVSHDTVTAKVRPALLEAGVIYYPVTCVHSHNGNRAECEMTVRFANIDAPEDFIDVQSFGYGVDSQDKGPGKAMSYAVKYALLKCLGLETGDDADHDDVDHSRDDPANKPDPSVKTADNMIADIRNYGVGKVTSNDKFIADFAKLETDNKEQWSRVQSEIDTQKAA